MKRKRNHFPSSTTSTASSPSFKKPGEPITVESDDDVQEQRQPELGLHQAENITPHNATAKERTTSKGKNLDDTLCDDLNDGQQLGADTIMRILHRFNNVFICSNME